MKQNPFSYVREGLDSIAAKSGTLQKQATIAQLSDTFPFFVKVVHYALNPYLTFKMSGEIKDEVRDLNDNIHEALFKKLDDFCALPALTKDQKENFTQWVQRGGSDCVDVVNRILNKDLRCGAKTAIFRKASDLYSDLPVHHPMKGEHELEGFFKRVKNRKDVCWSWKLDGTRCWVIADLTTDAVSFLSFNGIEIPNFQILAMDCLKSAENLIRSGQLQKADQVIFDGEVVNINGDFSHHMTEMRRINDMDPSGFRMRIFDIVVEGRQFWDRWNMLQTCCGLRPWEGDPDHLLYEDIDPNHLIGYLPHYALEEHPVKLAKKAISLGLEGIMLKTWSHEYQHKRSWDWCKVKVFNTEDLKVVDKVEGRNKYKGMLGALVVDRQGVMVEVGSGYTDEQRKEFWKRPPVLIEVKFQEVTNDGSLRFPTFVRVRTDKE